GAPRPYVTGESQDVTVEHLATKLWPTLAGVELPDPVDVAAVDALITDMALPGIIAPNAARCALELATLDCALRASDVSVGALLPPQRATVTYGGVVTATSLEAAVRRARQMKLVGLTDIKLKVGMGDDVERVRAVREAIGPQVSLRLDANGAWHLDEALQVLRAVEPFQIAAVEQPLPRDAFDDLRALKRASPIPLMVDESLVTLDDAERLLGDEVVDMVNIRISKCGGLYRSMEIARQAAAAGVGVQVGSHVGETAILSATGRHLAAWLPEVAFVEGSYGTLLLVEDVSAEPVHFGHRGRAPVLLGPGLGVEVVEERLGRYAQRVLELSPPEGHG
ncbi:MAG: enolase, partial [Actinomycetota bacterium]|nr:enolase [Actinomycetota bacterium]